MIYYFSGTGNSRYICEKIAHRIKENIRFIPSLSPSDEKPDNNSAVGFVFPVYSWGVPPVVLSFINNLSEEYVQNIKDNNTPVWCVVSCGDEAAMTPEILDKTLKNRGLSLNGFWSVIMPNNYVLLPGFDVDSDSLKSRKLEESHGRIMHICKKIIEGNWEYDYIKGKNAWIKSRIIYPLFVKWGISAKKWYWNAECISCGKCARICPVGNIAMSGGHPKWGNRCTSCLACYHICPVHAVEYGNATRSKGQYYCRLHD